MPGPLAGWLAIVTWRRVDWLRPAPARFREVDRVTTRKLSGPSAVVPSGSAAVRLFIGPLLSYLLEALMLEPSEVRRRAEAELPVLMPMFVRTIAWDDPSR